MNRKTILILGIVIVVLVIAGVFLYTRNDVFVPREEERAIPSQPEEPDVPIEPLPEIPVDAGVPAEDELKFSSCVVLDEEYCGKGEALHYPNVDEINGFPLPPEFRGKLYGVGFNLPQGAKIYAPSDSIVSRGVYIDADGKEVEVIVVMMFPLELKNVKEINFSNAELDSILLKELRLLDSERRVTIGEPPAFLTGIKVKKGELIGILKDESLRLVPPGDYNYNFTIGFAERDQTVPGALPHPTPEVVKQYFRYIK